MSVDGRGDRTAMAKKFLNNTKINSSFQKIGDIRMLQGMNRGRLVDAAFAESIFFGSEDNRKFPYLTEGKPVQKKLPFSFQGLFIEKFRYKINML